MCEWQLAQRKQDLHLSLKSRFFLVKMCIVIIFAKEKVGDTSNSRCGTFKTPA